MAARQKFIYGLTVVVLVGVALAYLPAGLDELNWRQATEQDSAQSYADYLQSRLTGKHAAEARDRHDERSWTLAEKTNTRQVYRTYLSEHPNGKHGAEAGQREEELAWQETLQTNTLQAVAYFRAQYPHSIHIPEAMQRQDDLHWQKVEQETSSVTTSQLTFAIAEVDSYLAVWPEGRHREHAQHKKEDLQWQSAQAAKTIAAHLLYLERYPAGRHVQPVKDSIAKLKKDDVPYWRAIQSQSLTDLETFLKDFPGHSREKDIHEAIVDWPFTQARREGSEYALQKFIKDHPTHRRVGRAKEILKDMEGLDIVDLIKQKKIKVKTCGNGIQLVNLQIKRLVDYSVTVNVPIGTYFVAHSSSSQNMVSTNAEKTVLTDNEWHGLNVDAACANRTLDVPHGDDSFTIQRSPNQQELVKLTKTLESRDVDSEVKQAAVWIVTDDADYDGLGILVSRQHFYLGNSQSYLGGTRVINEYEAAMGMKLCDEAGINIKQKAIWWDRKEILKGLKDEELRAWLKKK